MGALRLTRGTDYGIQGMLYLAMQPEHKVTLLHEIAERRAIPESYLGKIFQDLSREGLVRSHRGARGGFSLARAAADITLLNVIEALEGPIALGPCLDARESCPHSPTCPAGWMLCDLQAQIVEMLSRQTLEMLVTSVSRGESGAVELDKTSNIR